MRVIKIKLSISKISHFWLHSLHEKKGSTHQRKLEPKALEGKFVGYTKEDKGFLVYVPNTRKVVAVRDVIIKESNEGSIPDNTDTPDLLDEGHSKWGSGKEIMIIKTMAQIEARHIYCNKGGVA